MYIDKHHLDRAFSLYVLFCVLLNYRSLCMHIHKHLIDKAFILYVFFGVSLIYHSLWMHIHNHFDRLLRVFFGVWLKHVSVCMNIDKHHIDKAFLLYVFFGVWLMTFLFTCILTNITLIFPFSSNVYLRWLIKLPFL